jgi:hypothetical protein
MFSRINEKRTTNMFLPEVANAAYPDLPIFDRIFYRSPTIKPLLLATIRTVQQKEIDITKATLLDALGNTLSSGTVVAVAGQFGGIVDILTFQIRMFFQVI